MDPDETWPSLPLEEWEDTYKTLHRWFQIVGKIRLVRTPWINHSWHVTLYLTSRGLTTSPIPYGPRTFQIDFDFIDHALTVSASDGSLRTMELRPRAVADFHEELFAHLGDLGLSLDISAIPNEVEDALPLDQDREHRAYDASYATRCWLILSRSAQVFQRFRAPFIGKCSPVHFFWGGFDLAVTRFSGRLAPPHPGGVPHLADWVVREAYSHEVSSCGFWPGGGLTPFPLFYSYAYPEPSGFRSAPVRPRGASYNAELGEFILPYEEVRQARDPEALLLDFLQTTYEAAANLGDWNRMALERRDEPGA